MKDLRTTTFARPLTFNYLSTFNGDVVFNGDVSFPFGLTFGGKVNACGGIFIRNSIENIRITTSDATAIANGITVAPITLNYFVGTLIFSDVTINTGQQFRIDLTNAGVETSNDIVFAQVISDSTVSATPPVWACSVSNVTAVPPGGFTIHVANVGGNSAAPAAIEVAFQVIVQTAASPC